MKFLPGGLIAGLALASVAVFSPHAMASTASAVDADGNPQLLTELQFAAGPTATLASMVPSNSGWSFGAIRGASLKVQSTSSPAATDVRDLEGTYPVAGAGGWYVWAHYSVATLHTEDIYLEFWAKMPAAKEGCKFVKIFGERSTSTGDADATIPTDYTGADYGGIWQVAFGDGTALRNDSQNNINLSGVNPHSIGRSFGTAKVLTPQMSSFSSADWGTAWHHFRIHIKFNSGTTSQNEVPDGEFYLEIDGKVYVDATDLYDRNPANGPIDYIEFFGWAQKDPQPFQLWYDDIRISTGGFMSQALPDPPTNIAAQ
jgi:hypothetical protein